MKTPTLKSKVKPAKPTLKKEIVTNRFHYTQIKGIEELVSTLNFDAQLVPTTHCRERASEYGMVMPTNLNQSRFLVVEVEQVKGRNTKFLVRFEYNETTDIIVVIRPVGTDRYLVATIWDMASDNNRSGVNLSLYSNSSDYQIDSLPFGKVQ